MSIPFLKKSILFFGKESCRGKRIKEQTMICVTADLHGCPPEAFRPLLGRAGSALIPVLPWAIPPCCCGWMMEGNSIEKTEKPECTGTGIRVFGSFELNVYSERTISRTFCIPPYVTNRECHKDKQLLLAHGVQAHSQYK